MKEIEQALWKLSLLLQNVQTLETDELLSCYGILAVLKKMACTQTQKDCVEHQFSIIKNELTRRDLSPTPIFVEMDEEGNFLSGREDLKKFWSSLEFDKMVEVADDVLKHCFNEEQRYAFIELQREIVCS